MNHFLMTHTGNCGAFMKWNSWWQTNVYSNAAYSWKKNVLFLLSRRKKLQHRHHVMSIDLQIDKKNKGKKPKQYMITFLWWKFSFLFDQYFVIGEGPLSGQIFWKVVFSSMRADWFEVFMKTFNILTECNRKFI